MYLTKFNKNSYILLKSSQSCYGYFYNRIIESYTHKLNSKVYLDFGLNCFIEYSNQKDRVADKSKILVSLCNLNDVFDDISINYFFFCKDFKFLYVWFFIKKSYSNKCYLRGRYLNMLKNGYSIGVCGTVGFLSRIHQHLPYFNKNLNSSVFYVKKLDLTKKVYTLSQKNIVKQSSRVLFKLSLIFHKNDFC